MPSLSSLSHHHFEGWDSDCPAKNGILRLGFLSRGRYCPVTIQGHSSSRVSCSCWIAAAAASLRSRRAERPSHRRDVHPTGSTLAFLTAPVACGGANIPLFDALGTPVAQPLITRRDHAAATSRVQMDLSHLRNPQVNSMLYGSYMELLNGCHKSTHIIRIGLWEM